MDDNIDTIKHVLQKEFPDRAVQHQFSDKLHTFKLDGDSDSKDRNQLHQNTYAR